jgi:hypothetical protein
VDDPARRIFLPLSRAAIAFVALAVSLCCASTLAAQEVAVPVDVQVPLLAKVLNFDRNLTVGAADEVVLGVLYQSRYRTSANVADEVKDAVRKLPGGVIGGRRVRTVAIDLDETMNLASTLTRQQVTVLYVTPLRAADLHAVAVACRASQVTTITGVPTYVETGLAIGIGTKGERPEIVVNLAASRAEGADFNAQLLKLARIVP